MGSRTDETLGSAELAYREKAKECHKRGADHNTMVNLNLAIEEARQYFKEREKAA